MRTFIGNTSFTSTGFTVQTFGSDLLDSLLWDFGDGQTYKQTSDVGTGAANHTYAAAGTYTVTLERWGVKDFPMNTTPLHCVFSLQNTVYEAAPAEDICGGDFLTTIQGSTVTFSDRSVIQAPAFNAHSTQPLWDFGNGQQGVFINRIYEVTYAPGTYTACLYYGGFSFNDGGHLFDCSTCNTFTIGDVGMAEDERVLLRLFPVPTTGSLELVGGRLIDRADVLITDAAGRTMITARNLTGDRLRFDTASLGAGTYFLRVSSGGGVRTLPFVKL